jgi:hypothetical protein
MLRIIAHLFNDAGNRAADRGDRERAQHRYQLAARIDPWWSAPHYNLGLQAKYEGRWEESLRFNQRAAQLDATHEGAWWNLGIAATALRDWPAARNAWRQVGVNIPEGDGEWAELNSTGCIRLNPVEGGEVVWGDRIDPARTVITNVPFPESMHRFRDIVLHDGAPNGHRMFHGHEIPVFDALEIWQPSSYSTYQVIFETSADARRDALNEICEKRGLGFEDWATFRIICKKCSEGNPGQHDCSASGDQTGATRYAIAAESEGEVYAALEDLADRGEGRPDSVECLLQAS